MTETAGSTNTYEDVMIAEEDEFPFMTAPGTVEKWIGGFKWLVLFFSLVTKLTETPFRRFSTVDERGRVDCLDKWDDVWPEVECIFFFQGKQLLVAGALYDEDGDVVQPNEAGKGKPRFAPNSVVLRVLKRYHYRFTYSYDVSNPNLVKAHRLWSSPQRAR